jgi:peptide/nickel transport system permease protein
MMNRPTTSHASTVLYATSESEDQPPGTDASHDASRGIPKPPRGRLRQLAGRLPVLGLIGLAIVVFWLGVSFIGPLVAPYKGGAITSTEIFGSMSAAHPLGTDFLGRDMLSRVLYGAQYTVGLALAAALLASSIGTFLGLFAAVSARWLDEILCRLIDAVISIPSKVLALVVIAAFGSSVPMLITVAALAYIPGAFRISRSLAVNLMTLEYVQVAKARGEGLFYIARVEVLPNMIHPVLADFGLRFVFIVLLLSGLSFLGLGVQPPDADWGSLVRENIGGLAEGAPAVLMPAVAIATLTVGVNLLIDSLRRRGDRKHGDQ